MPARPADAEAAALPVQNAAPLHHLPAMASAAPPGGAPAPVGEYAVTMPVHSPQFAEALGVQVSVLARGGIERAELQLNPASMGPLSVQITLDAGQAQAQVFFGSDSAQTRQAVEAGMPALAAALRDAGFTLSGGGVSQHPGDPRQHGAGARGTTNFGLRLPAAPDEELRPLRSARAAPGRLDLYA
jgi:flagellar hook-length control protein FliK